MYDHSIECLNLPVGNGAPSLCHTLAAPLPVVPVADLCPGHPQSDPGTQSQDGLLTLLDAARHCEAADACVSLRASTRAIRGGKRKSQIREAQKSYRARMKQTKAELVQDQEGLEAENKRLKKENEELRDMVSQARGGYLQPYNKVLPGYEDFPLPPLPFVKGRNPSVLARPSRVLAPVLPSGSYGAIKNFPVMRSSFLEEQNSATSEEDSAASPSASSEGYSTPNSSYMALSDRGSSPKANNLSSNDVTSPVVDEKTLAVQRLQRAYSTLALFPIATKVPESWCRREAPSVGNAVPSS